MSLWDRILWAAAADAWGRRLGAPRWCRRAASGEPLSAAQSHAVWCFFDVLDAWGEPR